MRKWMTDKLFLYHWVRISILLFIYDIIVMNVSYGLALWLRFDFRFSDIPYDYLTTWVKYIPIHTACTLILMFAFKLYRSMWRFASFDELSRTSIVCAISMALHIVGTTVVFQRMPISYYVMGGILQYILITGIRFSYRIFRMLKIRTTAASVSREIKNTMIIGAGEAGRAIISEFNKSGDKMHTKICCIIDDNKNKKNRYIDGIPIVGTRIDIQDAKLLKSPYSPFVNNLVNTGVVINAIPRKTKLLTVYHIPAFKTTPDDFFFVLLSILRFPSFPFDFSFFSQPFCN